MQLRMGYAVASNSLNVLGNDCGSVVIGRDDGDDEGAFHRDMRRAGVHDWMGHVGRVDAAA